jgi:hypothetical protein
MSHVKDQGLPTQFFVSLFKRRDDRELCPSNVNFNEKNFQIKGDEEGIDFPSTFQTQTPMLCVKTPV